MHIQELTADFDQLNDQKHSAETKVITLQDALSRLQQFQREGSETEASLKTNVDALVLKVREGLAREAELTNQVSAGVKRTIELEQEVSILRGEASSLQRECTELVGERDRVEGRCLRLEQALTTAGGDPHEVPQDDDEEFLP